MEKNNGKKIMDIDFEKDNRIITFSDARYYQKGCVNGWRSFIISHGFDWKTSIKNGILAQELWQTEDSMAQDLVRKVYERK